MRRPSGDSYAGTVLLFEGGGVTGGEFCISLDQMCEHWGEVDLPNDLSSPFSRRFLRQRQPEKLVGLVVVTICVQMGLQPNEPLEAACGVSSPPRLSA
jgi:hypothetical protein